MTSIPLRLYTTPEHDCSYLADKQARSLFLDPKVELTGQLYAQLNGMGFRRSGRYVYRPQCESCNACLSARVLVNQFIPSRSQKRISKRNTHLQPHLLSKPNTDEVYGLYEKYINGRHHDGDMYPPSHEQFSSFLLEQLDSTRFVGFYDDQTLVSVAVVDYVGDGVSALYTFYDPEMPRNALGVNTILWQINECRRLGLPYLYLGYWVQGCQKMDYKTNYQPLQVMRDKRWESL